MAKVIGLYIASSAHGAMQKMDSAELEAGKGIVGDRYYHECGTFSKKLAGLPDKEVTLIESEEVDSFNRCHDLNYNYGDFRRNIVTEGIRLNELVGQDFTLGGIRLRGVRLCEPCAHLAGILSPEIMPDLVHKAGLRATIVNDGILALGDEKA